MKVQELEDKLRKSEDLCEVHQSQYLAFAQRAADLEEKLDEMLSTINIKDENMSSLKKEYRQTMEQFNEQLLKKEATEKTLRKSINEVCIDPLNV